MIFPDVSLEDWLAKYPALRVRSERCSKCQQKITTNKPFINQKWFGLAAICSCGYHGASSLTPRTNEMKDLIGSLYFSVKEDTEIL